MTEFLNGHVREVRKYACEVQKKADRPLECILGALTGLSIGTGNIPSAIGCGIVYGVFKLVRYYQSK